MVKKIISRSKKLFVSPQSTILSAATIIMIMIIASRVLGLVRQRALAHFFTANELSLFFAAFRLPDLVFEVLVFGTFSSAFIPVFTKSLQKDEKRAWGLAASIINIGLILFVIAAVVLLLFSGKVYGLLAPGYSPGERAQIVQLTKVLFAAQGFFVISYVLTGVLESSRRFLVPALAPLFYNLGIILATIFGSEKMGLMAPTLGVSLGAFSHFLIQLPLALKLGFRFSTRIRITQELKKVGKLALPKVIEVSFLQISKVVELFLTSLVSTASYTYFTFGNSLQLLPVGLFGTSIAKAALPTLSRQSDSKEEFSRTLWKSLNQMVFLIIPLATILIVLRIPVVRLAFGTEIFSWESTVQTSMVVSAFAFGIVFQAASALLSRAFYALHNTKTPVIVSVCSIVLIIVLDFVFVRGFSLPTWGLAAAFSIGSLFQAVSLYYLINKRLSGRLLARRSVPLLKFGLSALGSGSVMFFLLKFFDKYVWIKRLSFLGKIESTKLIPFEIFVLDTRYTANLLILTMAVSLIGLIVYIVLSVLMRTSEVWVFIGLARRMILKRRVGPISKEEQEPITPLPTESADI